jgi:hypothetical protein
MKKNKKNNNIKKPLPTQTNIEYLPSSIQSAQNIQEVAKNILTQDEKDKIKEDLINWLARKTLVIVLTISVVVGGIFALFLYLERDRTDLKLENQTLTLKTQIDLLRYQNQDCQKQLQSQYAFLQKLNKN